MIFRKLFESWIICRQQDASRDQKSSQNYRLIFRKLFESWKLCVWRKLFESWKLCVRRKLFKSWKLCVWCKLFESWKLCIRLKSFESWKICIRRKLFESWKLCICGLPISKIAPTNRTRREIKRARDGSNKQETLVGVSGLWLLLIKRCSAKLSLQSNQTKVNDFAMGVANKKRRLRSSRRLPWSSRMGWQAVSTTIFKWLLNLWLKMRTY